MSREILFRGKRIDNGEWAYGYYGKTQRKCTSPHAPIMFDEHWIIEEIVTEEFSHFRDVGVIADTVGQFTGLTDKNGKKIFERDMVKDNYGNKGFVFYSEHFSRWQIRFTSGRDNLVNYGDIGVHIFDWIYPKIELEIIGNIHDKEENE